MLTDFFRINMPYGIAKNEQGGWMAFNREYMPLGYNSVEFKKHPGVSYLDQPIYTLYAGVTEKFLKGLADSENSIKRDEDGNIETVFLYNDGSNPVNQKRSQKIIWDNYFEKIQKLSKLKIK